MIITEQNIFRHELIGLYTKITDSSHKGLIGIEGKVVNETKNTITIEQNKGDEKVIPKNVAIFQFNLPDGKFIEIDGKIIVARPEDRIKKKFRKFW